ncbi:NAD(P)/FAD-dependent oxidoreductase [Heliophilum fasciatum]|uniref:FAD-dependent protein C-terminal domain-containing protein n=1 Tax=Heliophilum fasciatum TaxID=35700 RepID=A0A4R2RQI1_9FIRM|nr:hypothetical protein [Heliophilum fasciatum]MCW2277651.1 putative FAD-dependent dehydrogenase [Heliophilum fasciatum]TCP64999.1 hypothetical protein EDD73_10770 [Heliophilum fasciatum]
MKIRIANLRSHLDEEPAKLRAKAARRIGLHPNQVADCRVVREAIDARKKTEVRIVSTVELTLKPGVKVDPAIWQKDPQVTLPEAEASEAVTTAQPDGDRWQRGERPLRHRPVVIGAGPCGYFAALQLAEAGLRPILLERGGDVERRAQDVGRFWHDGTLDPESNVQFGEGGAGTFSDGKLTTRTHDRRIRRVMDWLIDAGAPVEIAIQARPHVGTDRLRKVVAGWRKKLLALGGEIFFGARVEALLLEPLVEAEAKVAAGTDDVDFVRDRRVVGVRLPSGVTLDGRAPGGELAADVVVLAIGHSARDTVKALYAQEVPMEAKSMAIGVRIEHPQAWIDRAQYGEAAGHPRLGVADYQLHSKLKEAERTVFSFCMCPGGQVVAAASEKGGVVTNGMSSYARATGVANSALVVSVTPEDFPTPDPLGGMAFQRECEQKAFQLGGGNYQAPAQRIDDFLADRKGDLADTVVEPTYRPGVTAANLRDCLPKAIGDGIAAGIADFGRKISGYHNDNIVMTGVETRTSSPWRIPRDATLQSPAIAGLYPAGEGAGYAGGIVSAAVDGLRVAEAIIGTYRKLPEEG